MPSKRVNKSNLDSSDFRELESPSDFGLIKTGGKRNYENNDSDQYRSLSTATEFDSLVTSMKGGKRRSKPAKKKSSKKKSSKKKSSKKKPAKKKSSKKKPAKRKSTKKRTSRKQRRSVSRSRKSSRKASKSRPKKSSTKRKPVKKSTKKKPVKRSTKKKSTKKKPVKKTSRKGSRKGRKMSRGLNPFFILTAHVGERIGKKGRPAVTVTKVYTDKAKAKGMTGADVYTEAKKIFDGDCANHKKHLEAAIAKQKATPRKSKKKKEE